MRHSWVDCEIDKRSRYNRTCKKCGCHKIVSPWNSRDVSYKKDEKTFLTLPKCQ